MGLSEAPSEVAPSACLGDPAGDHGDFIIHGPTWPPLRDINSAQLLDEQGSRYSDKIALVSRWQGVKLSYQSLQTSSRDIAHSLLTHGVRPRDHVVVLAGNAVEYAQLFFAVSGIGAVFAIVNPTFTAEEIGAAIDFLDPKGIFIADRIGYRKYGGFLVEIGSKRGHNALVVQLGTADTAPKNVLTWRDFSQLNPVIDSSLVEEFWAQVDCNDTMCIQFTSGTTGPRKASMLTHRNLLNNAFLVGHRLNFTSVDVLCCSPPLFHCFGLVCGILAAVMHGGTVVLPSEVFNAEASLQAVAQERCTAIHAVPTMFQAMLDYSRTKRIACVFRLRTGIIAGSSLSVDLLRRLSTEFGLSGLAYAFGMTELSAVSFMTSPSETSLLDDCSSVGTPLPHTYAKAVGEDLTALPPGSRGELLVSGYLVFEGYYRHPDATKNALVQDSLGRSWLRTGDIVTLSASGGCTIVGRVKDMIKRGGENIAPRDIESALELHPDVAAAAVIGIPDTRWGEVVVAFVERAQCSGPGLPLSSKDLRGWLRGKIAPHKIPEHVLWVGEAAGVPGRLPVNASGKILKNELSTIAESLINGEKVSK